MTISTTDDQRMLTSDQLIQYQQTGYLHLRGLFSAGEVAGWQAEADRLAGLTELMDANNLRVALANRDGRPIVSIFARVRDISPLFDRLMHDRRILGVMRELYGEDALLFKDKLVGKPAGVGGPVSLHQDAAWWQGFPVEDLVSVLIAIDAADRTNGALEVFPGYVERGLLSTPGELRNMNVREEGLVDLGTGEIIETEPGDLVFFHAFVPHRSEPNTSPRPRRQLYSTYNPIRHGDLYQAHQKHYDEYARGLRGGSEKLFWR
ncbi:MAG TPA: phytanoyl-CoA dioxygenase family protein [Tepidisphaeraceae bacterium]|jgi:hypothetical protein